MLTFSSSEGVVDQMGSAEWTWQSGTARCPHVLVQQLIVGAHEPHLETSTDSMRKGLPILGGHTAHASGSYGLQHDVFVLLGLIQGSVPALHIPLSNLWPSHRQTQYC